MNQEAAETSAATEDRGALDIDRTLLCCLAAWGGSDDLRGEDNWPWKWLAPAWRDRLRATQDRGDLAGSREALSRLRWSHRLQIRPRPDTVHPSWYARALQDESPAVRQWIATRGLSKASAMVSAAPPVTAAGAEGRIEPSSDTHLGAPPEIAGWVLALWTERLVGGEPLGTDDPPAIVALAGLSSRQLYRLAYSAGLAKAVLAGNNSGLCAQRPSDLHRADWLRQQYLLLFGPRERQPQSWARRELARPTVDAVAGRHRRLATLGLFTLARLLEGCQPYRVRWALQHLPYPISKRIRTLLAQSRGVKEPVRALEATILKIAWRRLVIEGQVAIEHPEKA